MKQENENKKKPKKNLEKSKWIVTGIYREKGVPSALDVPEKSILYYVRLYINDSGPYHSGRLPLSPPSLLIPHATAVRTANVAKWRKINIIYSTLSFLICFVFKMIIEK